MTDIKINPKFKELLPALSPEEYNQLEESILAEGVRESVSLWRGSIVDGHNRVSICEKHNLDFPVKDMYFETEDEVLEWIYINQLGRRNLTGNQKTLYIGELYSLRKKKIGGDGSNQHTEKSKVDILTTLQTETKNTEENTDTKPEIFDEKTDELTIEYDEAYQKKQRDASQKTAQKIAKDFGVSEKTVRRAEEVAKAVEVLPKEEKTAFVAGKITQKAVIEKAREVTEPKPPPIQPTNKTADAFTETAKRHGFILAGTLKTLETQLVAAKNEFHTKHSQSFFDHTRFLRQLDTVKFSNFLADTNLIKTLHICPKCKGEKCGRCKNTGYLIQADYKDVIKEMEI